jgi:S-adenosylmethionine decarboxylase
MEPHAVLAAGGDMSAAPPGKHWLVEFHGAASLDRVAPIRRALKNAATAAGATLLKIQLHHFGGGNGVTGVALLAESHISIHTWPERGYAAIDIFMCGARCNPAAALASLEKELQPARSRVRKLLRRMPARLR